MRGGVKPTKIAYNNAIWACARSKRWEEAVGLVKEMEEAGPTSDIYPDHVSFGAAIHACALAGKADEALHLLRHLGSCGVTPNHHHYLFAMHACQRVGRWKQAWDLLMEVREGEGVEPAVQMYETVLQACVDAQRGREVMQLQGWIEHLNEAPASPSDQLRQHEG